MTYHVRIYCHASYETGTCNHIPSHPVVLPEPFESIRVANDRGWEVVADQQDGEIEWEVLNERGKTVC